MSSPATVPSNSSVLPVNDLAAAYQPRRVWAAQISIIWNLLLAAAFISSHAAWALYAHLERACPGRIAHAIVPLLYIVLYFAAFLICNYPLELYFGYLEERQFGLAKHGVRAWTRDWLTASAQHAALFIFGALLLLVAQRHARYWWVAWMALTLAVLFFASSYFAFRLLPRGLFFCECADSTLQCRLEELAGMKLPPVVVYHAAGLRDYSGGLMGLGNRQVLLISHAAATSATDPMLRFVLLHEMGHRRYHHLLLATFTAWAWIVLGLYVCDLALLRFAPHSIGHPPAIACIALCLTAWMAVGEPILAYLGRRLEYQADRFFLRSGGTVPMMRGALSELANRNLARTEELSRRQNIFHPLPCVWNRLHAAQKFVDRISKG